jgi:Ca2+-binding RTX toxin-like protein
MPRSLEDPKTSMTPPRHNFALQPLESRTLLSTTLFYDPITVSPLIKQARIVASGDFNNDLTLDLAVVTGSNSQTRIRGVTVTIFTGQLRIWAGDGAGGFNAIGNAVSLDALPRSIVAADFNKDGKTDIAMALPPGEADLNGIVPGDKVGILLAAGNGIFTVLPRIVSTDINATQIITGDFNGDTITDLAVSGQRIVGTDSTGRVTQTESQISVHFGAGNGLFTTPVLTHISGNYALSIASGDFNSDRKSDLAVGSKSAVQLLSSKGDGTFDFPAAFSTTNATSVATPDLNGDGRPDILWLNSNLNTANYALSSGKGRFAPPLALSAASGGAITTLFSGDIDGDGKIDLILGPNIAGNGFFINQGLGSFIAFSDSGDAVPAIVGDFTGDGRADIFSSDFSNLFIAAVPPPPATPPVYISTHHTLVITGTRHDDEITLAISGSRIITTINGQPYASRPSRVRAININAGKGNDHVILDKTILTNAAIFAGSGNDSVQAGNGNDTLHGQTGSDNLNGGKGADFVEGGPDNDTVAGGKGPDQIFGNAGADTFRSTDDESELFDFNPNQDNVV